MKILWLNANLLLPLDKGGKLRTWHLMRHLAARHDITYVSFVEPGVDRSLVHGMREVCSRVETVSREDAPKGTLRFYADVAGYLTDRVPYAVAKYRSEEYADRVARLLETGGYDLVVCDFLVPAVNLPPTLPCPGVVFTHNVEAEIWRRHAETQTNPVKKALFKSQWRRMLRFERDTLRRFGVVLAVSETDRDTFNRLYGSEVPNAVVVKTGVDTKYFAPAHVQVSPRHLVFTGSMDWIPNEDAMLYFVRDILPLIREREPDVTVSIVGRAPTPAVQALAKEHSVEVTGRVDDVRPHIAKAAAYVVPIRVGGGTRLKIFEAMAMGKPVVSTTVGAEGLPVTAGNDILIEDTPERFAAAVAGLLRNEVQRTAIGQRARALVVGHYDWSAVGRDLEQALLQLVATGSGPREAADGTGRL